MSAKAMPALVAELREWIKGTRSWTDQHRGEPNSIELTERADEATIRLLLAKIEACRVLESLGEVPA